MGPFIAVIVIVAVLVIGVVMLYNNLVKARQQANNAWSQIEVQLKRRYDLIPNLVETVKGYMKHEQDTLEKVIQARNSALGAKGVHDIAEADANVTSALGGIFALSEAYPELRSNENMLSLQEELKSTENKISFARQYYNDAVSHFNTLLETFPSNLMAGMGRFTPRELFEVTDLAEREPVKVSF